MGQDTSHPLPIDQADKEENNRAHHPGVLVGVKGESGHKACCNKKYFILLLCKGHD